MHCFFLRLHVNLRNTFEAIARYILGGIVNCEGDNIHFVRDKWIELSIKDFERKDRGSISSNRGIDKRERNLFHQISGTDKTIRLGRSLKE